MFLSESINLGFGELNTMSIVLVLGYIFWVFVAWFEARKDGFDDERFFDMLFLSTFLGVLFSLLFTRGFTYFQVYRPNSAVLRIDRDVAVMFLGLLGSFIPPLYVSKRRKWSIYRIYDIYSLAFGFFIVFVSLGRYVVSGSYINLIIAATTFLFYLGVLVSRGNRFPSGVVFSIFCFYLGILVPFVYQEKGYLIFSIILFIIGLVNLFFRIKRSMLPKNLPKEFILKVKNLLLKREKELQSEQQGLINEDPYLQQGRTEANSESMDEAILEDTKKVEVDARMGIVKSALIQVKKALATIKIGKYGVCEVCGSPIDPARLKAYPEATTCLKHADRD